MTNEQKVLLKLVGASLTGRTADLSTCEEINWQAVARESDVQSVLPMVFDAASKEKENIPSDVYKVWSDRATAYLLKNAKVQYSQQNLVKRLGEAGYRYTIIKGESSGVYYHRPDLRTLGDVDFLVDPKENEEIKNFLCDEGFTCEMEDHECHLVFKKPNEHLEMHREISGIPHGEAGEKIRNFVEDILDCRIENPDFSIPQKHHHGLIVLLHTQHHLVGEGVGLRHLCDWAAFVDKTKTEPFWEEKLLPFLAEIGFLTFTKVLTKTCAIAFELDCPSWADADENLCNELLEDVLSGGNFGAKQKSRKFAVTLISNRGKDPIDDRKWHRIYEALKKSVTSNYPITCKYPILYPFFAGYKALKFLALGIVGKKPSLVALSKDIDKRKSIYQQLKIFEV